MKKKIYMQVYNHFDIMWRRPFLKGFDDEGMRYISYADLEKLYIVRNMDLAERYPQYRFEIESVMVAENFIRLHPEYESRLRKLLKSGQAVICGSGYCIIDCNMPNGETLLRNFLLESTWKKANNLPVNAQAKRSDAFGNCAQLPQVLRGFGYRWVGGLAWVHCNHDYWRGLDKTSICTKFFPMVGGMWDAIKYAPCPTCRGTGEVFGRTCPDCKGEGIDFAKGRRMRQPLKMADKIDYECCYARIAGEEFLPFEDQVEEVLQWNKEHDDCDVVFATPMEMREAYSDIIDAVASEDFVPEDVHDGELVPGGTGIYVTRIESKQQPRRLEHELMSNDTLAAMLSFKGCSDIPKDEELWKNIMYMYFHDSGTGTHVDAAHEELVEYWAKTDKGCMSLRNKLSYCLRSDDSGMSVVNPSSYARTGIIDIVCPNRKQIATTSGNAQVQFMERYVDDRGLSHGKFLVNNLAPYAAVNFDVQYEEMPECEAADAVLQTLENASIENEYFRISADEHGLTEIIDRKTGKTISTSGIYRPLEFIYTHDEGSPWETISSDQSEDRMVSFVKLASCEKTAFYERMNFEVRHHSRLFGGATDALGMQYTVTLYTGMPRIDLSADVDWSEFNTRLRLVLPLTYTGRHMYEVPFGILERKPYEPVFGGFGKNGDYPAINWAGVEAADQSVALVNHGTPSYRILDNEEGSVIYLSLLRSPTMPTCLHDKKYYSMMKWEGMQDHGWHHFDCAIVSYNSTFSESSVIMDADGFNTPMLALEGSYDLPEMPCIEKGSVYLSCVKAAEDGHGVIVRIQEFKGEKQSLVLRIPASVMHAAKSMMSEDAIADLPIADSKLTFDIKPYEVITVRLEG